MAEIENNGCNKGKVGGDWQKCQNNRWMGNVSLNNPGQIRRDAVCPFIV